MYLYIGNNKDILCKLYMNLVIIDNKYHDVS